MRQTRTETGLTPPSPKKRVLTDPRTIRRDPHRGGPEQNYLHDWENLWEDDAGFSQVLVQNPLVKIIGGVFDLGGLEKRKKKTKKEHECEKTVGNDTTKRIHPGRTPSPAQ